MIHADTDGLLDPCHCGSVAGIEVAQDMGKRARCTECCEQTIWCVTIYGAMSEWNLARRAERDVPT